MILESRLWRRNFEFGSDFFLAGDILFCQNYFPRQKKNQVKIQNSASIALIPESFAFMSRKHFVDKRIIGEALWGLKFWLQYIEDVFTHANSVNHL